MKVTKRCSAVLAGICDYEINDPKDVQEESLLCCNKECYKPGEVIEFEGSDVQKMATLLCNMDMAKMGIVYYGRHQLVNDLTHSQFDYIQDKVVECATNSGRWLSSLDNSSLAKFADLFNEYKG